MSAALITSDWFLLGREIYFRTFEIYCMQWSQDIRLSNFIVSSASFGGPLALRLNNKKIVKCRGLEEHISIYSAAGVLLTKFKWTGKSIVHMGWSNDEKLICIQEDGNVIIYDIFGKPVHKFSIFQNGQDCKVVAAKIFLNLKNITGVSVMTSDSKIFVVNSIKDIKTRQFNHIPESTIKVTSWDIVSEELSTEVLLARGKELYRLKQDEHHINTLLQPDISIPYTSILEMTVSWNAQHLCLFTDSGYLWLGSTDLRCKYCEIDTSIISRPKQIVWCGNEAIVAYWENNHTVLIVGKCGQTHKLNYNNAIHLVSEVDSVRIISNTNHELLQEVPDIVQKIFRINSTEPGSFLIEASKQFQKENYKANEYINLIKNNLKDAINQCLDAVGYEFDPIIQKMLIRAAQLGKCFVTDINSDKYVKMCRLLRVLNAVGDCRVGIPLTILQLKYIRVQDSEGSKGDEYLKTLLNRLITRNMYFLALPIAKYLKIPKKDGSNYILIHWAKYKVSQHHVEEQIVARDIAQKLGYSSDISYSEIAEKAVEHGKNKLAIKLLDYELKANEQVKLLLKLGEVQPALVKAVESGDTDLVYMVILKLRETMSLGDFKMTIRNFPVAQSLYIKYCKEYNTSALSEIYIQEDDFSSQAQLFLVDSLNENKSHMRDSLLTSALGAFKKGRKDLYVGMCEEALKLLKLQRELEEKLQLRDKLEGKSIHDTCKTLLDLKETKLAEKVKHDFKIPDKRYWWIKISALGNQSSWGELETFSKVKKSPIGYAPFVDVCLVKNNQPEAMKYLLKVNDDLKVKYYLKMGCLEEAANIAFKHRDIQNLMNVQNRVSSKPELLQKITDMIELLNSKK